MREDKSKQDRLLEVQRRFVKNMVVVSAALVLVAFLAISLEGYNRLISQVKIQESADLMRSLSPSLNEEVLDKLSQKKTFSIDQIDDYFAALVRLESLESIISTGSATATESTEVKQ